MNQLNPDNPFARVVRVVDINPATGQEEPATSGTPPTGFFATSKLPNATPQPDLTVNGVYIGNQPNFQPGDWLLYVAPASLSDELLDPIFSPAGTKCYFHYTRPGSHHVVEELKYAPSRAATVVP